MQGYNVTCMKNIHERETMSEYPSKNELEKKVVEARNRITLSQEDLSWITAKEVGVFLRALAALHYYYLTHDGDTTAINFEVLHAYLSVERVLQRILRNPKSAAHHVQAHRLLEAIEGSIDDLIKQGYRQVYPEIYESFDDEYLDEDERFERGEQNGNE